MPLPDLTAPADPGTTWIPRSEAETRKLDVDDESLVRMRETIRKNLAPPGAPAARRAPPPDIASLTTRSSLAGLAAVVGITVAVGSFLVLWVLVAT